MRNWWGGEFKSGKNHGEEESRRNFEISMENPGPESRIEQECDTGKQSNHNNSTGEITVEATHIKQKRCYIRWQKKRSRRKAPKPETHNPTKTQNPRHTTPQKPKTRDTPHKNPKPGTHKAHTTQRHDKRQSYKRQNHSKIHNTQYKWQYEYENVKRFTMLPAHRLPQLQCSIAHAHPGLRRFWKREKSIQMIVWNPQKLMLPSAKSKCWFHRDAIITQRTVGRRRGDPRTGKKKNDGSRRKKSTKKTKTTICDILESSERIEFTFALLKKIQLILTWCPGKKKARKTPPLKGSHPSPN